MSSDKRSSKTTKKAPPKDCFQCPYCLSQTPPVEVHGHLQCAHCGVNVDPCCGGAPLEDVLEKNGDE